MRPNSLTPTTARSLRNIAAGLLTILILASFKGGDSIRPYIKFKKADTGESAKSSIGKVNLSRSVMVIRSTNEVHALFNSKDGNSDYLVTSPTKDEIAASMDEVNNKFSMENMWSAGTSTKMVSESNDEVTTQFEKENAKVITINPNTSASTEEVNSRFETENKNTKQ